MSTLSFVLHYLGCIGLLASNAFNYLWLDFTSFTLLVLGCWLHALFWSRHIKTQNQTVSSLEVALDLICAQRKQMGIFVRCMPNITVTRLLAQRYEYKFARLQSKTLAEAVRILRSSSGEYSLFTVSLVVICLMVDFQQNHYSLIPGSYEIKILFATTGAALLNSWVIIGAFVSYQLRKVCKTPASPEW